MPSCAKCGRLCSFWTASGLCDSCEQKRKTADLLPGPDRLPEGNPVFGCLLLVLVVALLGGGTALIGYFNERAERRARRQAAARKKEDAANDLIAELNNLPPGRINEFNATGKRRADFLRENSSFREKLHGVEDKWMHRTLVELGKPTDPAAVIIGLRRLGDGCKTNSGKRFLPQVQQALERAIASAVKQSADLLGKDNVGALDLACRCLAAFTDAKEDPPTELAGARRIALDRCIEDLSEKLKKIPADDEIALAEQVSDRKAVEKAARSAVAPLRQAEGRWLDGTVAVVLKEVEPQAAQHPDKVFARLEGTRTKYGGLFSDHPETAKALTAGEERCLKCVVDRAVADARKEASPATASARLRRTAVVCASALQRHEELAKTLKEARRDAINSALKKARADADKLIEKDRFQAAAALSALLFRDFADDAEAVGLASLLGRFRDECGYLADLARQAGRPDPS